MNTVVNTVEVNYLDAEKGYRKDLVRVSDLLGVAKNGTSLLEVKSSACVTKSQAENMARNYLEMARLYGWRVEDFEIHSNEVLNKARQEG